MRTRVLLSMVLGVFVIMIGVSCSSPPAEEMMQAETALQAAQAEGAETYAAMDYKAAADALADAKSKVESKDYDAAREAAVMAKQKADEAKAKVAPEKLKMRGEIEATMAALNEEWDALMKQRLTRKTKAAVTAAREAFAAHVTDINGKIEAEDYIGAQKPMKEAQAKVAEVKEILGIK